MTDESRARSVHRLNRLMLIAGIGFLMGIAVSAIAWHFSDFESPRPDWRIELAEFAGALLLLASPVLLTFAIFARVLLIPRHTWRFSLRGMLLWMTIIAIALGILAYLLRQ